MFETARRTLLQMVVEALTNILEHKLDEVNMLSSSSIGSDLELEDPLIEVSEAARTCASRAAWS
jgi:hypothetical protein